MATWDDSPPRSFPLRRLPAAPLISLVTVLIVALGASAFTGWLRLNTPAPSKEPRIGFVVVFGQHMNRVDAIRQARLVRSSGYLACITREGQTFRVISRAYDSRAEAQFWSGIFAEIEVPVVDIAQEACDE